MSVEIENEPFWPAVDKISRCGEVERLQLRRRRRPVSCRGPGGARASGCAAYSGPFRMEVLEVQGQRNRRQPRRKSLKLQLEVAWEPRLRPIALFAAGR